MKFRIKTAATTLLLLSVLALCSCSNPNRTASASGFYFDTIITITLYGTDDRAPIDRCFALAQRYEKLFSNTIEDSDISRINAHPGESVEVDPETADLLFLGIQYGQQSEGRFDITVGGLSDLWNIPEIAEQLPEGDNETDASVLPDPDAIADALSHVDYHSLTLDGCRACLSDPDAKLDLGGIAKGYIADRMKESLTADGITSAIINLGGNVLTVGAKPDGSNYRIGIQKPFADGEILGTVSVNNRSAVTSGVYERYYRVDGRLYHHILDLSDGYPCDNGLYGVTILSDRSVDGDALSTACFALGLKKGLNWIEALPGIEAVFVDKNLNVHCSSGAEALYSPNENGFRK